MTEAHAQQMEIDQEGGDGVLHSLGRGLSRVGQNIAAGVAAGQDLRTAAISGVAEPIISGVGDMVMRRILPQPRPLLDIDRAVRNANALEQAQQNANILQPSIILQPHQPNIGATQQPLPPAAQQPALPAVEIEQQQPPRPKPKAKATPRSNFQEGSSSSSSGNANAPPPQQEENQGIDIKSLYKQSKNIYFSGWGTKGEEEVINKLSKLPLNDYSQIEPKEIDMRTLQSLFNIAKVRNQLTKADETKIKEVIDKNDSGGSANEREERLINLFNEIFRPPPLNVPRKTNLTRKTNMKEGTTEEQDMASPTLIIPSKIGIQNLREVFEEANNRNTINTRTYRNYRRIYNNWVKASGNKDMKKQYLQELKDLYRNNIYKK